MKIDGEKERDFVFVYEGVTDRWGREKGKERLEKRALAVIEVKDRQQRHVGVGGKQKSKTKSEFWSERQSNPHLQPDNDPGEAQVWPSSSSSWSRGGQAGHIHQQRNAG